MTILDKYEVETIDYGTTGWNGIHSSNMQKLEDHLHTRLLVTVGENVSAYDAVYPGASGKFWKAKAQPGKCPAIGLVIEAAVADATNIRVQRVGPITNVGWSWTPYQYVYLSRSTPGGLTQTEGANCQLIGWAESATKIILFGNVGIGGCPGTVVTTTTTTTMTTTTTTT